MPYFSATVRQFGKSPEKIIKNAGLDPEVMTIADTFIPYSKYRRLLVGAVEETGCERFGLIMSENLGPQSLGVVGFSMQQSTDVGAAFGILSKFLHLHDQHGSVTLEPEDDDIRIAYLMDDLDAPAAAQAIDVSAVIGHNLLKTLIGSTIKAKRYEFPYPQPRDLKPYAFLQAQKLVFDTDSFGIIIERRYFEVPIANNDPQMADLLDGYMEALDARAGERATDKVELLVKDLLATGECTLEAMAELFKVTPRTLQNKLQREGTSFHDIVERVRKTLALHYLRSSQMNLTNIALLIGYSDSSAFSRSFRRWYDETPSQCRKSDGVYSEGTVQITH